MKKNVEITNRLKQTFNKKNQPIYNCFQDRKKSRNDTNIMR